MTYRRAAVATLHFDGRLLGAGAQVYNDMAFSLAVRRRGWKVVYDPAVVVDHYPSVRFDDDRRDRRSVKAVFDGAYNHTLTMLEYLPRGRRLFFWFWATAVGQRATPGFVQSLRIAPLQAATWREFGAVVKGRVAAALTVLRSALPRVPGPR